MTLMWSLLGERGNARIRVAVSLAAEGGLRLSEICGVRVQDIDLVERRCFVSVAKSSRERYAFFGERTKSYLEVWMRQRDPGCGHDILLYNGRKRPYLSHLLRSELNRVLCTNNPANGAIGIGFDSWNFHRLRHTMLSNFASGGAGITTIMMSAGWRPTSSRCFYVKGEAVRRDYDNAMSHVPYGDPRSSDHTNLKTNEGA
jgi:integrase